MESVYQLSLPTPRSYLMGTAVTMPLHPCSRKAAHGRTAGILRGFPHWYFRRELRRRWRRPYSLSSISLRACSLNGPTISGRAGSKETTTNMVSTKKSYSKSMEEFLGDILVSGSRQRVFVI